MRKPSKKTSSKNDFLRRALSDLTHRLFFDNTNTRVFNEKEFCYFSCEIVKSTVGVIANLKRILYQYPIKKETSVKPLHFMLKYQTKVKVNHNIPLY